MRLSGWGRYPVLESRVCDVRDETAVREATGSGGMVIARGNGRAYGDSAISPDVTLNMCAMSRMLSFDPDSGLLVVEAGVLLGDIIAAFLPRGWFPPVTPGTKFVSVGGMAAADVHGKNHHRDGSFGRFVDWLDVMGCDGIVRRCSPNIEPELFGATLGGMGLTGVILRLAMRLNQVESGWIRQTTLPAQGLDHAMEMIENANDARYSAAWIDCLGRGRHVGRGLLMLGEHASTSELSPDKAADRFALAPRRKLAVPFELPSWTLNPLSARAFNALYYRHGLRAERCELVSWDSFFYPLDSIQRWNRIYGHKGLLQFQCVIPLASARAGLWALLGETSRAGLGSFLAVLKRFGPQQGEFSFPMEGYTLALDFPVSVSTFALLDRLDQITLDYGGRFYLAKDARMTRDTFFASDPRATAFAAMRDEMGWSRKFVSAQSQRLGL